MPRQPPPAVSRGRAVHRVFGVLTFVEERPMAKLLLLGAFVASANAGAVELTKSNFDAEVKNSGKNAFIKVQQRPPGPCQNGMPPPGLKAQPSMTDPYLARPCAQFLAPW